jgi:hypothetical protein
MYGCPKEPGNHFRLIQGTGYGWIDSDSAILGFRFGSQRAASWLNVEGSIQQAISKGLDAHGRSMAALTDSSKADVKSLVILIGQSDGLKGWKDIYRTTHGSLIYVVRLGLVWAWSGPTEIPATCL